MTSPSDEDLLERLNKTFRKQIPSGTAVMREAMQTVIGGKLSDTSWIKKNFSELVERVQARAYEIYLSKEAPAASKACEEVLGPLLPENTPRNAVFELIRRRFWVLDRFFLGLTQGRRPRAGKAFETVIRVLFESLGYPYVSQPIINGQPDFLLPSEAHYRKNAIDCIVFTVKRSLRERWRQITTEGARGFRMFLATIDESIGRNELKSIRENRIILVVPKSIKQTSYADETAVIDFERFFRHELDPAMEKWREDGVVP